MVVPNVYGNTAAGLS